ncbi:hypothetical protein ACLGI4_16925 [Streptomyces sp. HMX112]|uniref:hypothetical protein n=1 Tax=Streptomyces sp. HMX112 TaxID=3390850 RepID=UPI003A8091F4
MIRNVIGAVLALVGAAAAVLSPFRAWYDGRHGRDYRVADLFGGITAGRADLATSLLLPFAFAALLTLVGLLLLSRPLVALAALVVLGFTVLWMIRQGQAADGLTVDPDGSGLGWGVALAGAGGLLLMLAALVMRGRTRRHGRVHGDDRGRGDGHGRDPFRRGRRVDREPEDGAYGRDDGYDAGYGPGPGHGHDPDARQAGGFGHGGADPYPAQDQHDPYPPRDQHDPYPPRDAHDPRRHPDA